jgi:hypothetical protein
LEKESFLLEIGEKKSIAIKAVNTDNLSPGGHYGVILANIESVSGEKSSNIAVGDIKLNSQLTSLVFLRKEGGVIYDLELTKKEKEISLFSLPSNIRLYFENKGNIHLTARGLVSIHDPLGREIYRGIINNESRIILPESARFFPVNLSSNLFAFIPGKYKLTVQYRNDGKEGYNVDEEKFIFFPIISTFGLMMFFIVTLMLIFRRRLKRRNNFV